MPRFGAWYAEDVIRVTPRLIRKVSNADGITLWEDNSAVNDVIDQTHVNHRLNADLRTWREYTGHDYKNVSTEQDIYGHTTRDIVCGNTTPGPPKERIQLCLQMTGPVLDGRRAARGGWYLPPKAEDAPAFRYGCFGAATPAEFCGKAAAGAAGSPEGSSPEATQ